MRAVEITKPGGPDVLKIAERPVPVPGEGEVLLRVAAAGVNRPDCLQRLGVYPPPPGASDLPGLEVAGTVAALGKGVTRWKDAAQAKAFGPYLEMLKRERENAKGNVRRLHAAGVTILAGSDSQAGVFPGASLHRELALLVEAGLTPVEAIRAATIAPASKETANVATAN